MKLIASKKPWNDPLEYKTILREYQARYIFSVNEYLIDPSAFRPLDRLQDTVAQLRWAMVYNETQTD